MKKFSWCGYEWISQERWGQIRPSHPYQWYDEDCIRVVSGDLVLTARNKVKEFEIDGEKVESKIAIGFASCTEKFGYGEFSVDIKLPKGNNLWCAFWMWAFDKEHQEEYEYSEVDCVEAYTDKRGSYFSFDWKNPLGFFRLESNMHYDVGVHGNKRHKQLGVIKKFLGFSSRRFTDRFMNFKMVYTKDYIEVYHAGKLVRRETDREVMKEFGGSPMNVILNYSFNEHVQWQDVEDSTPMICRNFKFTSYEKK